MIRILLLAQLVIQSRWLFFSQPQFLSKISKPERLSEAQVGSLIQNQVKCKGRDELYGVYVLDRRGVWMQKMLEEKEGLAFQLMLVIILWNKTDSGLGNP